MDQLYRLEQLRERFRESWKEGLVKVEVRTGKSRIMVLSKWLRQAVEGRADTGAADEGAGDKQIDDNTSIRVDNVTYIDMEGQG